MKRNCFAPLALAQSATGLLQSIKYCQKNVQMCEFRYVWKDRMLYGMEAYTELTGLKSRVES